jgi:hypothetical protein
MFSSVQSLIYLLSTIHAQHFDDSEIYENIGQIATKYNLNSQASQWGEWQNWSDCSTTCGDSAERSRTRKCFTADLENDLAKCVKSDGELWSMVGYCNDLPRCFAPNEHSITEVDTASIVINTEAPELALFTETWQFRHDLSETVPTIQPGSVKLILDTVAPNFAPFTDHAEARDDLTELATVDTGSSTAQTNDVLVTVTTGVSTINEIANTTSLPARTSRISPLATTEDIATSIEMTGISPCTGETRDHDCGCYKQTCWKYCDFILDIKLLWCWTDNPGTTQDEYETCADSDHASCGSNWECSSGCGF